MQKPQAATTALCDIKIRKLHNRDSGDMSVVTAASSNSMNSSEQVPKAGVRTPRLTAEPSIGVSRCNAFIKVVR